MKKASLILMFGALLVACGDDSESTNNANNGENNVSNNDSNNGTNTNNGTTTNNGTAGTNNPPVCNQPEASVYMFLNEDCQDTVAYSGQVGRQVLIKDLSSYILSLEAQVDGGNFFPEEGDVVGALDFYFRFDGDASAEEMIRMSADPELLQTTYGFMGSGKDLVSKLAGNDSSTDHKDWSTEFAGWEDATLAQYGGSIDTPEGMVQAIFAQIEKAAIDRANGTFALDPVTGAELPLHVTAEGWDLQQLVEKFLHSSLSFSQGADDYLDDDVEGKGLLASNDGPDGDSPYTPLAHQWDEGFGYFGAARNYIDYTDDEIAQTGYRDTNEDGKIDLLTEYNFGASTNAAKRDRGAAALGVTVDLTGDAWNAFRQGRALIASAEGPLSEEQLDELRGYRDQAVLTWEKAYMATVLHYINDTLAEISKFGSDDYNFVTYAKVWGEAKGFAFTPLYNRSSPLSEEDYAELHTLLGDRPVSPAADTAEIEAYQEGLRTARQILADTYDFDEALIGGDNGEDGW